MIRYDLVCESGHLFDGWFRDSAAYDTLAARGEVTCAHCGSPRVEKQLMAPGIPAKSNKKADAARPVFNAPPDPRAAAMMQLLRDMKKQIEANTVDVGAAFPEEARKIHYNETEKRAIRGQATPGEAQALMEEGIEVHALPMLPEEGN